MHWLQEHMRDHVSKTPSTDSGNLVRFPDRFAARPDSSTVALDLVSEAAEAIRTMQDRTSRAEARAALLAEQAIEKLRSAETRTQSAEAARGAAEENLQRAIERLEEVEGELHRTASRIMAAEAELVRAAERIDATEARARNAERAFKQLDEAIRAQLIGLAKGLSVRSAHAA